MRSRSRIAAWVVGLTATATVLTLGCGGGGAESGLQLNAIAFGGGAFVVVGDSDKAFVNSGNGFTPQVTGVAALDDVAWFAGRSLFVAVGDAGAIVTSPDGLSWTPQGSPTTVNLHGIAAEGGLAIAVGDGGVILASADGVAWTPRPSATDASLYGVAFGDDDATIVAVGAAGTVLISEDAGLTWQPTSVSVADGLFYDLYGIAFGKSPTYGRAWVAVGQSGTILRDESPNALKVIGYDILPNLNDVAFLQGLYVVVGDKGKILTSADGSNYGESVSNTGQFLYGSAFGNGTFYVVGSGGRALSSVDGVIYQDGKI